jgi:hypothetical protein
MKSDVTGSHVAYARVNCHMTLLSLEGLGMLHLRMTPLRDWAMPTALQKDPWHLDREEGWTLLVWLLDSLRHQGVLSFPSGVDPREDAFEPRNVALYVREISDSKAHVLGWAPKVTHERSTISNRRLDYLRRLLQRRTNLDDVAIDQVARGTLEHLWRELANPIWKERWNISNSPKTGGAKRLEYNFWEWVPIIGDAKVYRCNKCSAVSYSNLNGVCPTYGCSGEMIHIDNNSAWQDHHYRRLYEEMAVIPLHAEEHTAQWRREQAASIQQRFIDGEVNFLSCSTTFELGVDVGDLNAVLMRNVPPATSNYIQRAGRAGRRTNTAAYVLTYAQRRSHDLSYFRHPIDLVAGHIHPPSLALDNEIIIRRHMHAVLIAAFLRWAQDKYGFGYRSVGPFFKEQPDHPSGMTRFQQFLQDSSLLHPVTQALLRIVPASMHQALGIEAWNWLEKLINSQCSGILDYAAQEVSEDLHIYEELQKEEMKAAFASILKANFA